jgi:hypothetical protein
MAAKGSFGIALVLVCVGLGGCAAQPTTKDNTGKVSSKMEDDGSGCGDGFLSDDGDTTCDPSGGGGGGGGGDPGGDPGGGAVGGDPAAPADSDDQLDEEDTQQDKGPRGCGDGLKLAYQESDGNTASFTTEGQAELAHCVQDSYKAATGKDVTINSGTRSADQQAWAMYHDIYAPARQAAGGSAAAGCAKIKSMYHGDATRNAELDSMCYLADGVLDFSTIVGYWAKFTTVDEERGVPFSSHEVGNGIDIQTAGMSADDEDALNSAVAECGGTRNNESNHAHVKMGADASTAPYEGDDCESP